jgi:hypothetical protein
MNELSSSGKPTLILPDYRILVALELHRSQRQSESKRVRFRMLKKIFRNLHSSGVLCFVFFVFSAMRSRPL